MYTYMYMYICVIHTEKYMDQPTDTRETNRQTNDCQTDRQTDKTHAGDHCVHCMHENFQKGVEVLPSGSNTTKKQLKVHEIGLTAKARVRLVRSGRAGCPPCGRAP